MWAQLLEKPENAELKKMIDGFVKVGNQSEINFLMQQIQPQLMQQLEANGRYKYSAEAIKTYGTIGGTPHLDGSYTVFGEVVEGMDVIDKIAAVSIGQNDRPTENVVMKIKLGKK